MTKIHDYNYTVSISDDHSRVVLESNPSNSDYINANYISVSKYLARHSQLKSSMVQGVENLGNFIATQGPIENTVGDFWWMVWEKHIPMIIMLTNLEEKGKVGFVSCK